MKKTNKIISFLLVLVIVLCSVSVLASAQNESKQFVLLGDSIAYGTGLKNPAEDSYGALICGANGYVYKNYSVPGHTTDAMMQRLQNEDVVAGIADADIIAVSIGGNNFLLGNMLQMVWDALIKNDYSLMDKIIEELHGKLNGIFDRIKEINPDAVLLVQTLYNPRDDIVKEAYQYGVDGLNAQLRKIQIERSYDFSIVEVGVAFNNDTQYIQSDGIHPNEVGHYVIAQEYVKVLYEMGLGIASELASEIPELPLSLWEKLISAIKSIFNALINLFN